MGTCGDCFQKEPCSCSMKVISKPSKLGCVRPNVKNLPVGDNRLAVFSDKLHDFILQNADGLPYPSVLGVIDVVKINIMLKQIEEIK